MEAILSRPALRTACRSIESDAGGRLIDFLGSERASVVIRQSGMEPLGKRGMKQ
jgi:hypothetical protein